MKYLSTLNAAMERFLSRFTPTQFLCAAIALTALNFLLDYTVASYTSIYLSMLSGWLFAMSFLRRWDLTVDGDAFASRNGNLLPVRQRGIPAMLKISQVAEEQAGSLLMAWWDGEGAAPVLAQDTEALLMARALGPASLVQMVNGGRDEEATRILCGVVARLHAPRAKPIPALVPLAQRFE
eukprot:gene11081-10882_t